MANDPAVSDDDDYTHTLALAKKLAVVLNEATSDHSLTALLYMAAIGIHRSRIPIELAHTQLDRIVEHLKNSRGTIAQA